jgi:hypothetical protein
MYGQGAGVAGVSSTVTGAALLPNTGGDIALTVLSITTIAIGVLVTSSFVVTRIAARFYN